MKKLLVALLLLVADTTLFAQPAKVQGGFAPGTQEELFLKETEGYLRGSFRFTTAFNVMVLTGAGLIGIDLLDGKSNALTFVGFEIGFAGVEMSKYSPVALVKARRSFMRLAPTWYDTASYQAVLKRIRLAEHLSKVSVISNFLGEGLILLGFFQQDEGMFRGLITAGVAFGIVSLGTSIGTTVATQMARVELGKAKGTVTLGAGTSGIGVAYRIP
jgi:hypothetical protein